MVRLRLWLMMRFLPVGLNRLVLVAVYTLQKLTSRQAGAVVQTIPFRPVSLRILLNAPGRLLALTPLGCERVMGEVVLTGSVSRKLLKLQSLNDPFIEPLCRPVRNLVGRHLPSGSSMPRPVVKFV